VPLPFLPFSLYAFFSLILILISSRNDTQWDETEGALIRKYVFQDQPEVPWLLLANVLQRQFVRGTRQDPSNPIRPLSPAEIVYFHRQFFQSHPMVTQQAFTDFWEWFGKGVQKVKRVSEREREREEERERTSESEKRREERERETKERRDERKEKAREADFSISPLSYAPPDPFSLSGTAVSSTATSRARSSNQWYSTKSRAALSFASRRSTPVSW
jgi:hypothetical protein